MSHEFEVLGILWVRDGNFDLNARLDVDRGLRT